MEINICDESKTVDIWMTRAEQTNSVLRQQVDAVCARYKPQKYTVAVFQSGTKDLQRTSLDLLIYNRRKQAEREVRQEKQRRLEAER